MGRRIAEVDAYISSFDHSKQQMLSSIRDLVHEKVLSVEEVIKWRMPMFILPGFGDIIGIAAFAKHIGLYPQPEAVAAFSQQLKEYHTSKGAIQFPLDRDLPLLLIQQIIDYRLDRLRVQKKHQ